jgi:hypothetical protein
MRVRVRGGRGSEHGRREAEGGEGGIWEGKVDTTLHKIR